MEAAVRALRIGQYQLFRGYSQEAINITKQHSLGWVEFGFRVLRFRHELIAGSTEWNLDELRKEADYDYKLRGDIAAAMDHFYGEVLSIIQSVQRELTPEQLDAFLGQLSRHAEAFGCSFLASQLDGTREEIRTTGLTEQTGHQLQTVIDELKIKIQKEYRSVRADVLLLAAEFKSKLGDLETAGEILQEAERVAEGIPQKRLQASLMRVDLFENAKDLEGAIKAAEKAVEVAKGGVPILGMQASARLQQLRNKRAAQGQQPYQTIDGPPPALGRTEQVFVELDRAHEQLFQKQFDAALSTLQSAFACANTPALQRPIIGERAIVLWELGRYLEAGSDIDEAIRLLADEAAIDRTGNASDLRSRISEEENLYLLKAVLEAQAERPGEAWLAAERGRASILKREITRAGGTDLAAEESGFDSVRSWLASERAAMLSFGATRWGTLALSAGPGDAEPERMLLPVTYGELQKLLAPPLESESSSLWTDVIFGSLPQLSAELIYRLHDRILKITSAARVLYILPDSFLFRAPFAALTMRDGRALIDVIPVAMIPSATILLWCASRRQRVQDRCVLAIGVGEEESFHFRDQAIRVAALPWSSAPKTLLDSDATVERFTAEAPLYPVLYVASHGGLLSEVHDSMTASRIELANKQPLTARDVLGWKISADLVFLNGCQSGRFRLDGRTQVNGFFRAFPIAGANTLVATIAHVDPQKASDLSEIFFQEWLRGATKAEALKTAQLRLKGRGLPSKDWASHCLIGDFV